MKYTVRVSLRLSRDEAAVLRSIQRRSGASLSESLRIAIREAGQALERAPAQRETEAARE